MPSPPAQAAHTGARRRALSGARLVLEGLLCVWSLRLLGDLVIKASQRLWADFLFKDLLPWSLAVLAALVLRTWAPSRLRGRFVWVAVLAAGWLGLSTWKTGVELADHFRRVDALGLWVPVARGPKEVCRIGRRCWTANLDGMGLRNPPDRPAGGDPLLIAVGDSFVYGVGVDDAQTLPRRLEARLVALGHPRARVVNAGLPGTSLATFPLLVRHAASRASPDLVVVLVNGGDPDALDINTRLERTQRETGWRLLAALNLESAVEAWRLRTTGDREAPEDLDRLRRDLDRLLEACQGRRLLLATDLAGGHRTVLVDWLGHHPEVAWLDAAASEPWRAAGTLGDDPHWSPAGNDAIAGLLVGQVERCLAGSAPRDSLPSAPPKSPAWCDLNPLISDDLQIESAPDAEVCLVTLRLIDGTEVRLKAFACGPGGSFFRLGRICFSLEGGAFCGREAEVRQALEARREVLEDWIGPPGP